MNSLKRREPLILLLGDAFVFLVSLWLSLFLRTFSVPGKSLFFTHLIPFGFLFVFWILVFYIAGLYEKRTLLLRSKLPDILFGTQAVNSIIAVIFFYFIPFYGITPKTLLFIYLIVSFALILYWRAYGYFFLAGNSPSNALIIGSGVEMKDLYDEVNSHPLYNLRFITSVDLNRTDPAFWDEISSRIYSEHVSLVAIDLSNDKVEPVLAHLYNLIFSRVSFVDMHKIYEDVFDRVPLSLLKYNWFLENISATPRATYDALKRLMDTVVSFVLGLISLVIYPFVILAIKIEDRGPAFIVQERIGKNNKMIKILKFRSMTTNDHGYYAKEETQVNKVTKVGDFLRRSRIDELPQLWNVFLGELSLIGPRPELPALAKMYEKEIPYYKIRNIIKPGLSGWAQIYHEAHPHHELDTEETKNKLSYDLYYIKNRSFLLDLKIALRTIRTLLSRAGR
ncbi:MAG: sugar transferase [Parcubacteria group bacterium]|nr:sugar transferase [Parcubacteria group bacterium]